MSTQRQQAGRSTVVAELAMWSAEAERLAGQVVDLRRRLRLVAERLADVYVPVRVDPKIAALLDLRKPVRRKR